jgi:hypothetical protein
MVREKHHLLRTPTELSKTRVKCVIREDNKVKFAWDVLVLGCVVYVAFVMPYRLAFNLPDSQQPWKALNQVTNGAFAIDILLTFFSEVHNDEDNTTISNLREIALIYLKGWFWFDLITVVPLDWALTRFQRFSHLQSTVRVFRIARIYKLVRLLRISRLVRSVMRSRK